MLKGLLIATGVFLVLFAIASGAIVYRTQDSRVVNQTIIDKTTNESAAPPSARASPSGADSSATALDPTAGPAASNVDSSGQELKLYLDTARTGLLAWCTMALAAGLLASIGWLAHASGRAKVVQGPLGFRSARPGWLLGLLIFFVLTFVATFVELKGLGLAAILAPEAIITTLLLCIALGSVGYYISTAVGVSKVMRPSVPLATLLLR